MKCDTWRTSLMRDAAALIPALESAAAVVARLPLLLTGFRCC